MSISDSTAFNTAKSTYGTLYYYTDSSYYSISSYNSSYSIYYYRTLFSGTFNGGGHIVSGMYIDTESDYQGLFGYVYYGIVKNIGIVNSYMKGGNYVGGVVGYNYWDTISNCYNTGAVTGSNYVGGVAGRNTSSTVSNCFNTGGVTGSGDYVGGVTGFNNSNYGNISNCYNTGSVTGSGDYVGGVAGENFNGSVSNCYNTGNVTGSIYVGGVAGWNYDYPGGIGLEGGGTVSNCYNTGSVTGSSNVGGVAGENGGTVSNCYNMGAATGSNNVGSVAGSGGAFINGGTISNCYYLSGTASGGVGGGYGAGKATALTDVQMRLQASFAGWNFHDVWAIDDTNGYIYPQLIKTFDKILGETSAIWNGTVATGFAGGSGTEASPYIIETAGQLAYLAKTVNSGTTYSSKYIKLINNISLNNYNAKYWILNASEWTSIGTSSDKSFRGTFDGDNHTVSGLYIDTANSNQGLFGYVIGGTIKNIGIVDSYIKGGVDVGGVAGCGGTIINCYNTGSVTGSERVGGVAGNGGTLSYCYNAGDVTGSNTVGGVVGDNYSDTINDCYNTGSVTGSSSVGGVAGYNSEGTISNSFNMGNVMGASSVGGVAGANDYDGTVRDSYNKGTVTGSDRRYVGGIVGGNYDSNVSGCYNTGSVTGSIEVGGVVGGGGTVSRSYNTGSVTGTEMVGGVVGRSYSTSNCYNTGTVTGTQYVGGVVGVINSGTVINSYNTGSVTGSSSVGGVAGVNAPYTFSNCYYLFGMASGGIGGSDVVGQAEALTNTQMRLQTLFSGWNFTSIWTMGGNSDYPYPELNGMTHGGITPIIAVNNIYLTSRIISISAEHLTVTQPSPPSAPQTNPSHDVFGRKHRDGEQHWSCHRKSCRYGDDNRHRERQNKRYFQRHLPCDGNTSCSQLCFRCYHRADLYKNGRNDLHLHRMRRQLYKACSRFRSQLGFVGHRQGTDRNGERTETARLHTLWSGRDGNPPRRLGELHR